MALRSARRGGGAVLAVLALACGDFSTGTTGSGAGGAGTAGAGGGGGADGAGGSGASALPWAPPESLGDALVDPRGIATDLTRVYVGDYGAGEVVAIAKETGETGPIAQDQMDARYVAVAGTDAVWSASDYNPGCAGDPWSAAVRGGDEAASVFQLYAMCARPTGQVEAFGNDVYWIHGGIRHATPPAGAPQTILAGSDDTDQRPSALAIDASYVYLVKNSGGLARVPKGGGLPEPIDEEAGASAVAVSASAVYVTTLDGHVMAYDKTANGPPATIASDQAALVAVTTDDEWVVWAGTGSGTDTGFVGAWRARDGALVSIAEDQATPDELTIDKAGIYWTNRASGQVMVSWRSER